MRVFVNDYSESAVHKYCIYIGKNTNSKPLVMSLCNVTRCNAQHIKVSKLLCRVLVFYKR